MIRVLGEKECTDSIVERDLWIPMKITWLPRPSGQPMYVRVSGDLGGEVELKIDPVTGVLAQLIVISAPPSAEADVIHAVERESRCAVPIMDTSFDETVSGGLSAQQGLAGLVISIAALMKFESTDSHMRLWFTDAKPSTFLSCGKVRVGISGVQELVSFDASL
jgi:hypothetical protein